MRYQRALIAAYLAIVLTASPGCRLFEVDQNGSLQLADPLGSLLSWVCDCLDDSPTAPNDPTDPNGDPNDGPDGPPNDDPNSGDPSDNGPTDDENLDELPTFN